MDEWARIFWGEGSKIPKSEQCRTTVKIRMIEKRPKMLKILNDIKKTIWHRLNCWSVALAVIRDTIKAIKASAMRWSVSLFLDW